MPTPSAHIYTALQRSLQQEDGLGDYRQARLLAEAWCAEADTDIELAQAYYHLGVVHWLRGTLDRSLECFETASRHLPEGENLHLLIATFRHVLRMERYNSKLDGSGSSSIEVGARWDVNLDQQQLMPALNALYTASQDQPSRNLCWYLKDILMTAKNGRTIAEKLASTPFGEYEQSVFQHLVGEMERTAHAALQHGMTDYVVFPNCLRADILHRAQMTKEAKAALDLAEENAKAIQDQGRLAYCYLMRGDWLCAQLSHPYCWDFALVDSSQEHSQLSYLVENQEFQSIPPEHLAKAKTYYQMAESLYQQLDAKRGLGMVYLRYAYLAVREAQWTDSRSLLQQAEHLFRETEDYRNLMLCRTHQLLIDLQLKDWAEVDQKAAVIGRWGRWSGDFSYTLSLGMLINRFARHLFLRQSRYEGARLAYGVAYQLFKALDAPINATQTQVDRAYMLETIGDFHTSTLEIEKAADQYMALIQDHPALWTQAAEIAPVLQQHAIFLAAKGYNIGNGNMAPEQMSRFQQQLNRFAAALPKPQRTEAEWRQAQEQLADTLQSELLEDTRIYSLRQLASDTSVQANFLIPYYRYKIAERAGQEQAAEQHWQDAFAQLAAFDPVWQPFYETILWGAKREYEPAIQAFRLYLTRKEAQMPDVRSASPFRGTSIDRNELDSMRRLHHLEQCLSMWVNLKQFQAAEEAWQKLRELEGEDWWKEQESPWKMGANLAELCEGLGRHEHAMNYCDQAIELLEQQRDQLSRDELKTSLANDRGSQFLYLLAARLAYAQNDYSTAFWYAERGKARGLLDLLAAHPEQLADLHTENESLQLWRELHAKLHALRSLLAHERLQQQPDELQMQQWQQEIAAATHTLEPLEKELTASLPGFFSLTAAKGEVMGMAQIQSYLRPGQLLIEYYYRQENLFVWLIDAKGLQAAHHTHLARFELDHLAKAFQQECQHKQTLSDTAQALSQQLLLPWQNLISAYSDLYISPSGSLHTIPFHALPFGKNALGEGHRISYLPSANTLAYLHDVQLPKSARALIIGNPTGDLQAAETEAAFVAQLFAQTPLLGKQAQEESVRQQIPRADILHLATHGNLSEQAPLASSLSLAAGEELSLYEIMGLRMRAELVVLSACETGRGTTTQGDDVLGLSRGLLAAGAKSVIVSLWHVDDLSTSLLMRYFYQAIQAGQHPAAALQEAQNRLRGLSPKAIEAQLRQVVEQLPDAQENRQRSLRGIAIAEENDPSVGYGHPFYWAPFFYVGFLGERREG